MCINIEVESNTRSRVNINNIDNNMTCNGYSTTSTSL